MRALAVVLLLTACHGEGDEVSLSDCDDSCSSGEVCRICDGEPSCVDGECPDCNMIEVVSRIHCNFRYICSPYPTSCCDGAVCTALHEQYCLTCGDRQRCVGFRDQCCGDQFCE